jgi:hypothetical protein
MEREIAFELSDVPFHWPIAVFQSQGGLKSRELFWQAACEIGDLNHSTLATQEQPCFQWTGTSFFDHRDQSLC